jgi:hypothetical protein
MIDMRKVNYRNKIRELNIIEKVTLAYETVYFSYN